MTDRSYLSIGDVLGVLKAEFPDVTISKIRFLESQGLLDPERTPSGYRKFYGPDVERLRWILRQQKEHFLPLKVIKGRLSPEVLSGEVESVLALTGDGSAAFEANESIVAGAAGSTPGPASSSPSTGPVGTGTAPGWPDTPEIGTASEADERSVESPPKDERSVESPPKPDQEVEFVPTGPGPGFGSDAPAEPAVPGLEARGRNHQGRPIQSAEHQDAPSLRPSRPDRSNLGSPRTPSRPLEPGRGRSSAAADRDGVALTFEELLEASGLDEAAGRDLERFGLIVGRAVARTNYYDAEALNVAELAVELGRYGVGARHLRMYKTAAEREASFFEQIVTPLLKQRNPRSRLEAVETVHKLSDLGDRLRQAMLRVALRDLTGG